MKMVKFDRISGLTVSKCILFDARENGDDDLAQFLKFRVKIKDFPRNFGFVPDFPPFGALYIMVVVVVGGLPKAYEYV